jgi:hypothetical protein
MTVPVRAATTGGGVYFRRRGTAKKLTFVENLPKRQM